MIKLRFLFWISLGWLMCIGWISRETTALELFFSPKPRDSGLADDRLEDRPALPFNPELVDPRPLGNWRINASAAVARLNIVPVVPNREDKLLDLHPSYQAAIKKAEPIRGEWAVLPSMNMIDGKGKQFDDGLYAALDLAYFQGLPNFGCHVLLMQRFYDRVGKTSPAAPYLAAGLALAGIQVDPGDPFKKDGLLQKFLGDEVAAKPIGFYTWSPELEKCFRFMRFFQKPFNGSESDIQQALVQALKQDAALRAEYKRTLDFYARLTNPAFTNNLLEAGPGKMAAVFPAATSRETVLFQNLFRFGLPANVDLMKELIRRIRSGQVNLQPQPGCGWYDHQVYALETLLVPEKGEEGKRLLLTRSYKQRMEEAFKAFITKRRETHVRHLAIPGSCGATAPITMPDPRVKVSPRLRLEPCPSFYVPTARAYAFLAHFLEAALGKEILQSLHGLKRNGVREKNLYEELAWTRDLFYGLYLVSAEDLGMKPAFSRDEPVDQGKCHAQACSWLDKACDDPDLARDARVAVPIFQEKSLRNATRLWVTMGVRLAKLEAGYARPPSIKPREGGDWQLVEPDQLEPSRYLIAVDEFAEVELAGSRTLTREEWRAICDRGRTRKGILAELKGQR